MKHIVTRQPCDVEKKTIRQVQLCELEAPLQGEWVGGLGGSVAREMEEENQ
jgi:hypothetical protein